MSEAKTLGKVHIIEGRPWKDAIIKILEPRRCTGCRHPLYLIGPKASDHIHIRTADPRPKDTRKSDTTDWPAALCDTCHRRMAREGFTSFLDYRFTFHPTCRRCKAQRTRSALYGMPMDPIEEPWIAAMGCGVWGRRKNWVCGECGHQW